MLFRSVLAQKAIRDGDHLFVVEREWRLPPFGVDADGLARLDFGTPAADEALRRDIRNTVRWLVEQVHPGVQPPPPERPRRRR